MPSTATRAIPIFMTAAALWCAVLSLTVFQDYGVYIATRWLVTIIALCGAFITSPGCRYALVFVAIAFNPLIPIHLGREIWQKVDLVAAIILFFSAFRRA